MTRLQADTLSLLEMLSPENLKDVERYMLVLLGCQGTGIKAPSPDEWIKKSEDEKSSVLSAIRAEIAAR